MTLTDQESEIIRLLGRRKATVREVYEEMRTRKQVAYTIVMTMMNILERKRPLRKRQVGRAFIYTPIQSEDEAVKEMLHEFVDRVFHEQSPRVPLRRGASYPPTWKTGRCGLFPALRPTSNSWLAAHRLSHFRKKKNTALRCWPVGRRSNLTKKTQPRRDTRTAVNGTLQILWRGQRP